MPKQEEVAEIFIQGRSYRDFQSVSVTRDFGMPTSAFEFRAASPIESSPNWAGMKLQVGEKCAVRLAGRVALFGVLSQRAVAYDAQQHALQLAGLSSIANIVQSTVEHSPGEFKNYSLSQIANSVLKPHGIKFKLKGETSGADKPFERVNVQIGESVFGLIERLARFRNLYLIDDEQGNLVGFRSGTKASRVADLEEGRNIKSASVRLSDERALGKIEVYGQNTGNNERFGGDSSEVSAVVYNSAVQRYRPFTVAAEMPGDKEDMKMRAQHELGTNLATMIEGTIVVQGWQRDDGSLWIEHVGQRVSVYSPLIFPNDRQDLELQGVTHSQDEAAGTLTTLSVVIPGRLNGGRMIGSVSGAPNLYGPGTGAQTAT